jgi:cation/acetate symporter
MVGGGVLIKALIGIDYEVSVIAVGAFVLGYVLFGGMTATTWVQIVKAVLLVAASIVLVVLLWTKYGFFGDFLANVVADPKIQQRVATILGERAVGMTPEQLGQRFLAPGLLFATPIDQISLGMALVFGTAGLPHILMRFFSVPTAKEARKSVLWAMAIIGGFYVLTLFLGLGAALRIGPAEILAVDPGGNMAAPMLAQALGGGPDSVRGNFMLAFIAAVAFSTIIAVVSGLVLASASAIAHDLYVGVIKDGHASTREQIQAARLATLLVGGVAILIGILAKGQNVAHLVALAFAVAASANFPALVLTLFWRSCNTGGIVAGVLIGTVSAIGLVLVSPNMTYPQAVKAEARQALASEGARRQLLAKELASSDKTVHESAHKASVELDRLIAGARADLERYRHKETSLVGLAEPLFPLKNPGLISIPLGFLAVIIGSLLYRDQRAESLWDELYVRRSTGLLAARAARQ